MGFALATQIISAQVPSYVPTNGLIGYYPFNGNANDVSGNNHNGTVNGPTLTTDRFGNANSSYNFTGTNNDITLSNSQTLVTNGSFSISAWCTIETLTPSNYDAVIIGQFNGMVANDRKWLFGYRSVQSQRGISYYLFDNSGNPQINYCTVNWAPQISTWYHITWVFTGGNSIKTYINGLLNSNVSISLNNINNVANNILTKIGNGIDIDSPAKLPWNGKIDDVGIWNRGLTQEEITAMYNGVDYSETCNAVNGSLVDGLVAYYPFCGNAKDASGNSNNGTVNGATLTTDRFGNTNSAYNFDGNNFTRITVPNSFNLNLTNDFTISSWINGASFDNPQGAVRVILSKSGDNVGAPNGYNYGIWGNVGLTSSQIGSVNFQAQPFNDASTFPLGSSGLIQINNWYNFVVTYTKSTSTLKYYINNVLIDKKNLAFEIGVNSNELWIGSQASQYTTVKTFNGKIDDIGIWNRALTEDEINNLYNANICYQNITVTDTLVINTGILSYNPVTYNSTVTIYPNPAKDHITIDCGNLANVTGYKLKIFNVLGQEVFSGAMNTQQYSVPLNTLTGNGLYLVKIYDASNNVVNTKKIILQ